MTSKANPSINRPAEAFKTAGAIAYGGSDEGFISRSAKPTQIAIQDADLDETKLNAFDRSSSPTSLDVTIEGGEAFVFGSWLCKDTQTIVTLDASTSSQTVFVGWNRSGANDVIVGLDRAFSAASGDADQKIPLFTFDADSNGVIGVTDERSFDQISASSVEQGAGSGLDADTVDGFERVELGANILNDSANVVQGVNDINFGESVAVTDDGSRSVTVTLKPEVLARIFRSEDLSIHGKKLESGETITLAADEGSVVSEDYTVDGTLNIEEGGSITVI